MNMKKTMVRWTIILFACFALVGWCRQSNAKEVKILFTQDAHSYLDTKFGYVDGKKREFGNAARLATLVKENDDKNTLYVDGGDIAMGTLYQAAYSTDACELRTLGEIGCDVCTFGNHEFDYGCKGVTGALQAAMASGDRLPKLVEASFDFDGELTQEQTEMKEALDAYGVCDYVIEDVDGVRVAVFGIEGIDSIECVQADVAFHDYIETAKKTVEAIGDQADVIVCLSHSGTSGDGQTGEDFDLIDAVPGIDVVVSAHSHTAYQDAVIRNDTILVSAGCYLQYLGSLKLEVDENGISLKDYQLLPIDENVKEDAKIRSKLEGYKNKIRDGYLKKYADGGDYDDVLAELDFDMITYDEMYATQQEYDIGNLIADSYYYEAQRNGINDIDVMLVGLGTIRASLTKGPVKLADAFEICSLGVGADGSAGHPLIAAYITGKELKLLTELDASLGSAVDSIKMSYYGVSYTYNEKRMLLDRVTDLHIISCDGRRVRKVEDEKLYKVCCNMYAANMLGMLNGLTKGLLKIEPKYEDGSAIEDFYSVSLKDSSGKEIKEWVAFKNYLSSFEDGKIPDRYHGASGRKVSVPEGGLAVISDPGAATWISIVAIIVMIWIIVLIALLGRKHRRKRKEKTEE